jgi:hypothetical protein
MLRFSSVPQLIPNAFDGWSNIEACVPDELCGSLQFLG